MFIVAYAAIIFVTHLVKNNNCQDISGVQTQKLEKRKIHKYPTWVSIVLRHYCSSALCCWDLELKLIFKQFWDKNDFRPKTLLKNLNVEDVALQDI